MSEPVLQVRNLSKKIKQKWIINNISFEIRAGEILGFLGPNGAGKTTTIRMLVDLIRPTSGEILICGKDVQRDFERAMLDVGSIVENPELYSYLTGFENLEHFAVMIPGVDRARIEEVVNAVKMDKRIHDKVRTYSLGMRQRLGIAQALLGDPKLLILDEPTNGLDPQGIRELRAFVRELADEGMSIFISSHLLSEIELMCDRVAVIREGEIIGEGVVDEMLRQGESRVLWDVSPVAEADRVIRESGLATICDPKREQETEVEKRMKRLAEKAAEHERRLVTAAYEQDHEAETATLHDSLPSSEPQTDKMNPEASTFLVKMEHEHIPELNRLLIESGVRVYAAQPLKKTLEDLFLELTGGGMIG